MHCLNTNKHLMKQEIFYSLKKQFKELYAMKVVLILLALLVRVTEITSKILLLVDAKKLQQKCKYLIFNIII